MNRRRTLVIALGAAVVVAAALLLVLAPGKKTVTITAHFAEAPGLYVGNHVEILGIPVGTVTSIRPTATDVVVAMRVTADQALPSQVHAVLMAPDVVNDRFVQLEPAYSGGPRLQTGAVIPLPRTAEPLTVDAVFNSLDQLSRALGPQGANSHGALSALIRDLAQSLKGNGSNLHSAILAGSQALSAVASNPTQLASVLNNLGHLTQAAADNTTSYQSFANNLAAVSTSLAGDGTDIAAALSNLQQLFANLTQFVHDNQSTLGASVGNLQAFATRLASQQKILAQSFDVGPLALQNLSRAIDPNAPGGPALKARYDPSGASHALVQSVCGNSLLRGLTVATNPAQRTELDVDCLFNYALGAIATPPGASSGPNLSLSALVGGS